MALHWEIGETRFYRERTVEERGELLPLLDAVIWATMAVDLGEITEENLDEFTRRYRILYGIWGERPEYIDAVTALLPELVGLRTNVTNTSKAAFKTKVMKALDRDAREGWERARKAGLDAALEKLAAKNAAAA